MISINGKSRGCNKFFWTLLLTLTTSFANAQLVVDNTAPYDDQNYLVQDVLLGAGVTAFNISFNGVPVPNGGIPSNAIGFFDNTNSQVLGVGIDSGIVMTTGTIFNAVGPNLAGGTTAITGGPADADLTLLGGDPTFDGCILEFDFVPQADTIKFKYVFASEEYPEFVGGNVNDVFGFFVSGPGITGPYSSPPGFPNGSINIALIPGTTTPVSINDVNDQLNSQYYVANGDSLSGMGDTINNPDVQYDGLTVVLEAIAAVIACDTFHIKLAIADGGDGLLDSGVFLEAKSFSSVGIQIDAQPSYTTVGNDTNLYEACGIVTLNFTRFADLANPYTVYFNVLGSAIMGTDYSTFPDSVVFAAGQSVTSLSFSIFDDGLTEGQETVIIEVPPDSTRCWWQGIDTSTAILVINDRPNVSAFALDDTLSCFEDSALISVVINSGIEPFNYIWSSGDTLDSFRIAKPAMDSTIFVTLTDACEMDTIIDSLNLIVLDPALVFIANDDTIDCSEDSIQIGVQLVSGTMAFYNWPGIGSTDSMIWVFPTQSDTSYVVQVGDSCNPTVTDTITVRLFTPELDQDFTDTTVICPGDSFALDCQTVGGAGPYSYLWDDPGGGTTCSIMIDPSDTTIYTLITTDACGTMDTSSITVNIPQYDSINTQIRDTAFDCPNQAFIASPDIVTGGSGFGYVYNWAWDNGGAVGDSAVIGPFATSTILTLQVVDGCGNQGTATANISVPQYDSILVSTIPLSICLGDRVDLVATAIGGKLGSAYSFFWQSTTIIDTTTTPPSAIPVDTITYLVDVTDECGIIGTGSLFVDVAPCDVVIPNVITPNGDGFNDVFYIENLERYPNSKLIIFNRWGKKLYENANYLNSFDGFFQTDGVYFYLLELSNGQTLHGSFSVIR